MLYSSNANTRFAEIDGMAVAASGKNTMAVIGPNGTMIPMGIKPPASTLTPEFVMGDGNLIPGIGYGWMYTYFDSKRNIESPVGPIGNIVDPMSGGEARVIKIEGSSAGLYDIIYAEGDLKKEDGYYDDWTIAVNVTNNDYFDDYSEWQYRKVDTYTWEDAEQRGKFVLTRTLNNVDPDEEDQGYAMRVGEVEFEDGEVGGKAAKSNEIVLDSNASTDKGDYIMKAIFLVHGKGKGQKRWIIDVDVRTVTVKDDSGAMIEVERTVAIVDKNWQPKPKFVDSIQEERKAAQAGRFKRKNYTRDVRFYNSAVSTRYVIVDPLSHSDLVKRGHVVSIEEGNRVKLGGSISPMGGATVAKENVIAEGRIQNFKDKSGAKNDVVQVTDLVILNNADPNLIEDDNEFVGNLFVCEDTGYTAIIKKVTIVESNKTYAEIELEGNGKLPKGMKPKGGNKYFILVNDAITVDGAYPPDHSNQYLHGTTPYTNAELDATEIVIAKDGDDHYADELENIELYNSGNYFIQFGVRQEYSSGPKAVIVRQIKSALDFTTEGDSVTYVKLTLYEPLPVDDIGSITVITTPSLADCWKVDSEYEYSITASTLADGYYTGWKIMFYSNDPSDATKRGGKKTLNAAAATVIAYYDAVGQVVLDKNVRIGGDNITYCLYSEYTRTIGSKLLLYLADSNGDDAAWKSNARKRFIKLDHFASHTDEAYNDWRVVVMKGFSKQRTKRQSGGNMKKYYTVDDYDGDRQVIDLGSTSMMYPAPAGNEFVHVYDQASSITAFLDETALGDETLKDEIKNQEHMKATVRGFVPCPLETVDKIKVYRASESTEIYLFEGEKDNDADDWTSTLAEEELGLPLQIALANVAPAKYVINANNNLVFAGGCDDNMTLSAKKKLPLCISTNGIVVETGVAFDGLPERYTVRKGLPNIAMRLGTITNDDGDGIEQYIKINSDSRLNGQDDIIIRAYMRYVEDSADPGSISVVERARKLYRFEVDVSARTGGTAYSTLTIQQDDNADISEDDNEYNGMIAEFTQGKTSDNTDPQVIHRRITDYSFLAGVGTITLDDTYTQLDHATDPAGEFFVVIYKSRWRTYISDNKLDGTGDDLTCMTNYGIVTNTITQDSDIEDVDVWFIGLGQGEIQIQYIAAWLDSDASDPLFEYHAGGIVPKDSYTYQEPSCTIGDQSDNGISGLIHSGDANNYVRVPAQAAVNGSLSSLSGYIDVLLDRPFESTTGSYTVSDLLGKTTLQITSLSNKLMVNQEGIVELESEHDDEITGLAEYKGQVFIFQKNCVWQMSLEPLSLMKIVKGVGCISGNTLTFGRQGIYFLDQNARPRRWDLGSFPRDMSDKVSLWLDGGGDQPVDKDKLSEASGSFDWTNERYVLSLPALNGIGDERIVLIFDEKREAWSRYVYNTTLEDNIYSFCKYGTYIAACTGAGIWKMFSTIASKLAWSYESNWKEGPNTAEKVHTKRIIFGMVPNDDASVNTVKFKKDMEDDYATDIEGNAIVSTFTCANLSALVHAGLRGLLWKYIVSGAGAIKLRNLTIKYRPKKEADEAWDPSND